MSRVSAEIIREARKRLESMSPMELAALAEKQRRASIGFQSRISPSGHRTVDDLANSQERASIGPFSKGQVVAFRSD